VRLVELPTHPFFVATLFLPQVRSTAAQPHPLILAYLRAAVSAQRSARDA
jgi:CTP synthase (UTP-ammonia lyase)